MYKSAMGDGVGVAEGVGEGVGVGVFVALGVAVPDSLGDSLGIGDSAIMVGEGETSGWVFLVPIK